MATEGPLLRLTNVTRRYDLPDSAGSITVLDSISLDVRRGESVAVVGPSGSGKSTLLHLIGTLDRPTSGQILLGGNDLGGLDDLQLAAVRNCQIGFVFQAHYLLPQCTVLENVLVPTLAKPKVTVLPGTLPGAPGVTPTKSDTKEAAVEGAGAPGNDAAPGKHPRAVAEGRAARLLKRVGLGERLFHRPGQLSGGERQRVAVVRALINQPQLLLADEPTGALDQASAAQLAQLLLELNREENVTLIVVTHARDLARRMGRVLELKGGKLAAEAA